MSLKKKIGFISNKLSLDEENTKRISYRWLARVLIIVSMFLTVSLFLDLSNSAATAAIFIIWACGIDLAKVFLADITFKSYLNKNRKKFWITLPIFLVTLGISIVASSSFLQNVSNNFTNESIKASDEYKFNTDKKEKELDLYTAISEQIESNASDKKIEIKVTDNEINKDPRVINKKATINSLPRNYITERKKQQRELNVLIEKVMKEKIEEKKKSSELQNEKTGNVNDTLDKLLKFSEDNKKSSKELESDINLEKGFNAWVGGIVIWFNNGKADNFLVMAVITWVGFLIGLLCEIVSIYFNNVEPEIDKSKKILANVSSKANDIKNKIDLNKPNNNIITAENNKMVGDNFKYSGKTNNEIIKGFAGSVEYNSDVENLEEKEKNKIGFHPPVEEIKIDNSKITREVMLKYLNYIYENIDNDGNIPGRKQVIENIYISQGEYKGITYELSSKGIIKTEARKQSKVLVTKDEALKMI
jgi:hypothetical protein